MTDALVFDAHSDALQRAVDLGQDLTGRTPGHFDLVRAREGGLGAIVLTAWVDGHYAGRPGASKARAEAILAAGRELCERAPDAAMLVRSGADLDAARSSGRVGIVLAIEGGHALENDPANVAHFAELGVRVLTLTWNNHLPWARSCQPNAGPEIPEGLNDLGRHIVGELDAQGVVVDLSHAGERTFFDALEATSNPVIASHSCCKALSDHPRNLTDEQLRALAENGGVLGVTFVTPFLDEAERAREAEARATDACRAFAGLGTTEAMLRRGQWLDETLPPFPLERVVDHVLHACEVMGPEHVGLGSDFDGIERTPEGLRSVADFPNLAAALERRGVSAADRAAILGGNMARVFRSVVR